LGGETAAFGDALENHLEASLRQTELDKNRIRSIVAWHRIKHNGARGWRKLAPDKRHPKADIEGQEEWKTSSQKSSPEIDQTWIEEGPLRVMFQDEARFGRTSDTRRC